ncbi:nitroreductase [Anaerocolumna cellulosilytica]|uniref:Nitroreductase n=1 Tax=Anaerocolumna cellulosilytica TaxID=433286 RepID=A0A6S6R3Z5_9FIRM|nr:nitroreductase family protein [Anaerocolumna cellulosilytica]MBB5195836.1 nitroreductase [Anaerocolumna cellulosilytica]BCJ96846.1 nitroreductase [Anaerocolumna cellulosilytica]
MLDVLKTRRSIRKYQDKPIEQEKLNTILKAALTSPSSKGKRPWELIVVEDKETLLELSHCRGGSSKLIAGSAVSIVVVADKELTDVWIEDASILGTIIQLTAHSLTLGSCWVQIRERMTTEDKTAEAYVKEVLGIPLQYGVECVIALGYPAEEKEPYSEEKLPLDKIHSEKF